MIECLMTTPRALKIRLLKIQSCQKMRSKLPPFQLFRFMAIAHARKNGHFASSGSWRLTFVFSANRLLSFILERNTLKIEVSFDRLRLDPNFVGISTHAAAAANWVMLPLKSLACSESEKLVAGAKTSHYHFLPF